MVHPGQKLRFEIVTPEERLYQDNAWQVVLPAAQGAIGILPQHAPMVILLQSGIVYIYQDEDTLSERIFVGGGFAHIDEENCTVMADEAIRVSDIKETEVQDYIDKIHAEMEEAHEEDKKELLQKTLTIARAKLDLLETLRKGGGPHL